VYTSSLSSSLHQSWHEHLEHGHEELAEEFAEKRVQILQIHVISGFLIGVLAVILALLIGAYWKIKEK
jgi:hypothetical protein